MARNRDPHELAEEKLQEIADALGPAPDPTDDSFDAEGAPFNPGGDRLNMPLESFLDDTNGLSATFQGEEGAMLRPSDAPPSSLPPRTAQQEAHVRNVAQAAATLANPRARDVIDPNLQAVLANLVQKARELPTPDVAAWVDHRRVVLSGAVISVPNKIPRKKALEVLEALLQAPGDCKGDKRYPDGRVDACPCPTHNVVRMAQWNGFREKPHLWLSQHLAVEVGRDEVWDRLPDTLPYDDRQDGDIRAIAPRVLVSMFSGETTRDLMRLAKMHSASVISVFRVLTARICAEARRQKTPQEYTGQFDT